MSLTLVAFCTYLTSTDESWKPKDHDASKLVKAIKGESFNGYAKIPVNGVLKRLDSETRRESLKWLASWGAAQLPRTHPCVLIPIPGSDTTSSSTDPCRASVIANRIVDAYGPGASVADILRFDQALERARTGGLRSPEKLYPHLVALPWTPSWSVPTYYILVDDVYTLGGHVRACAAFVARRFGVTVMFAVCAGRTVKQSPDDPFCVPPETVYDFIPEQYGL